MANDHILDTDLNSLKTKVNTLKNKLPATTAIGIPSDVTKGASIATSNWQSLADAINILEANFSSNCCQSYNANCCQSQCAVAQCAAANFANHACHKNHVNQECCHSNSQSH